MKKLFFVAAIVAVIMTMGIISLVNAADAPNVDALKWEREALVQKQGNMQSEYAKITDRINAINGVLKAEEDKVKAKKDEKAKK